MQISSLPESINDQVQDLMADVFETIGAIDSPTFTGEHLLMTKEYFVKAYNVIETTDFLSVGDIPNIINAIAIDIDTHIEQTSEGLLYSWNIMKTNLERATSQAEFNAIFALFVPVILKYMQTPN